LLSPDADGTQLSPASSYGFFISQIYLGDAGLSASIPLIRTALAGGSESAKQLHLISVGISSAGIFSLGQHLQEWGPSLKVADVDFSGNNFSNSIGQISPVCHLQPVLRAPHLRRLVLGGCKCGLPVFA
jgi:hypothetical protein